MEENAKAPDLKSVMASARAMGQTADGRKALLSAVAAVASSKRAEEIDDQADEALDSPQVKREVLTRAMEALKSALKANDPDGVSAAIKTVAEAPGSAVKAEPKEGEGPEAKKADLAEELRKAAPDNPYIGVAVEIAQLPPSAWDAVASQIALGSVIRVNTPRTIANI